MRNVGGKKQSPVLLKVFILPPNPHSPAYSVGSWTLFLKGSFTQAACRGFLSIQCISTSRTQIRITWAWLYKLATNYLADGKTKFIVHRNSEKSYFAVTYFSAYHITKHKESKLNMLKLSQIFLKLTNTGIEEQPISPSHPVLNLLQFFEIHLQLLFAPNPSP